MCAHVLEMRRNYLLFCSTLLLSLSSLGCGGDGTCRISGKITFKGAPVPAGKIYFTPDGSKGTTGSAGFATIKNGIYDTSAEGGAGVVKGTLKVMIEGIDPSAPAEKVKGEVSGEATVKTLFAGYEGSLEVAGDMTKDFDVPAEAGKPKPQGEKKFIQP
jgi:hypothetical protein